MPVFGPLPSLHWPSAFRTPPRLPPVLVGAFATLAACASTPPLQPEPHGATGTTTAGPVESPSPARPTGSGELDLPTVQAEATRILNAVAQARQLAVQTPVKVEIIDKQGIRKFAEAEMYEDITPAELALLGSIEASMGVMPPDRRPEDVMLDLLEEGVLGLYDPKRKTLFIGDFVPKVALSMVVGHEIAHGLQDMHFDLERHGKPLRHRSDEESARRFVIEGEAQAAYMAWVSGEDGLDSIGDAVLNAMGDQALELAGAVSDYPVLARALQMPYADGTATIIRLVLRKGWSAVDALYADLPETTEQMLHVDKLLAREPARAVTVDPKPLQSITGQPQVWHDTLGEAALLAMLAQVAPSKRARTAAAGWGGDHYVALQAKPGSNPAVPMVAVAIAWDSPADAEQFATTFSRYLAELPEWNRTAIDRRGDVVVWSTGIPSDVAPGTVIDALWAAVTVEGGRGPR